MHYEEILPSPHLRKYIKCFWVLEQIDDSLPNSSETVLPDGSMEIVFNLADRFRRYYSNGKIEIQPSAIMVGQMRQAIQIEPLGKINLFGIRFQTLGAYHFFKFPMDELTDKIERLDSVFEFGDKNLEEQINESRTTQERIAIIEKFLTKKSVNGKSINQSTEVVIERIIQNSGLVSVNGIAKEVGISQRQLERHFRQCVGVSPKFFSRIIRLKNVLSALQSQQNQNLSNLALSFGYYDHAHFNHEFKEFAGKSPVEFLKTENRMSELFFGE